MKSLANPVIMKKVNTDVVRNALRKEQQATRQRLSELTNLSTVTVGTILEQLVSSGEIYETDHTPSNGGRPAHTYCFNAEYSYALLIYTHVQYGKDTVFLRVMNLFGECVLEESNTIENIALECLEPMIDRMLEKYPNIKAIGFGMPGTEYNGVMFINDYSELNDTCFSKHYREKYNLPVILENDVNLAVSGYCHANLVEDATVVYIYFPQKYEPGAGIFINGDLYRGMNNFAGELGFLPIDVDWRTLDYSDFKNVCKMLAKLIVSIICILNPLKVIIHGDFLTSKHLHEIKRVIKNTIDKRFVPTILLPENFDVDYETGLCIRTLELITSHKSANYF